MCIVALVFSLTRELKFLYVEIARRMAAGVLGRKEAG